MAALSYAGELIVSIQVDGAVADLDVLAAGVAQGFDRLLKPGQLSTGLDRVGPVA